MKSFSPGRLTLLVLACLAIALIVRRVVTPAAPEAPSRAAVPAVLDAAAPGSTVPLPSLAPAAGSGSSPAPTAEAAAPAAAGADSASAPTTPFTGTVVLDDGSGLRPFTLALDEIVVRSADGVERSVGIDPAGGIAGVRTAVAEAGATDGARAFPVLYEEGVERTLANRRVVTAEIRVQLEPHAARAAGLPGAVGISRPDYAPDFVVAAMRDPFAALDYLADVRATAGVARADVLLARQQSRRALPNDPLVGNQWHIKNTGQGGGVAGTDINVEPVWNYPGSGYRGAGVVVGVVDDGLQTAHPDLAANVRTDIDYDWNDSTPLDPNPVSGDDNAHGTSCAGNVAAVGNNGLGVTGSAPEAKIVGLRLIAAGTSDSEEAEAMAHRNDVIAIKSNSWGPNDDGRTLEAPGALTRAALRTATTTGRNGLGTIILWAGGNGGDVGDNSNNDGYANSIHTIAIGAMTNRRAQSSYSEPGANLVVVAPSSGDAGDLGITTVDRTGSDGYVAGDYESDFGGTSSATPTVAGVVALMLQRNPNLGWRDVQEILIRSAVRVNPTDADWTTNAAGLAFNHKFGAGLVDATAAVNLAATWTNLGAQTSRASTQSGFTASIPNNNTTGVTRTFDLGATNLRVEHVTVRVTITHSARGNLAITLTSPTGVVSRLAEVHTDGGDNYTDWTFMTVRNWGESSTGTWTLRVTDRSNVDNTAGGTLSAAELTVFGTAAATNPAPVVQLTSPADGSSYSIGASVPLAATATDLTLAGGNGTITRVDFLSGNSVVATDTVAPYATTWQPPGAGTYAIVARATDSEGAVGSSATATVTVSNRPPVVNGASLNFAPQAYSDQPLTVSANATDPEGLPVTLTYRWQSSPDGVTFTDAGGQTAATVATTAGRSWRCVVTPSDGVNVGASFTTAATMVLTRPPATATIGVPFSYTSDLVLRGTATTFTRAALINEFSQGSSSTSEWVEIVTLRAGSLRGWKLDDSTNDAAVVTFSSNAVWDNVPAGTVVIVYNGAAKDARLPADDADLSDRRLVLSSSNSTYFTGGWPGYGNAGDAVVLRDAAGTVIHQFGYGSNTAFNPNLGTLGAGNATAFTGDTEAGATTSAGWRVGSASVSGNATVVGVTPGEGNTLVNAAFVANLRSGFFNQPAAFRLAGGVTLPAGLTLSSGGVLSGTPTGPAGNATIGIEKFNGSGEVVSQSFALNVVTATPTYAEWIAGYAALADATFAGDPDRDGRANGLEYLQGTDPGTFDGLGLVQVTREGGDIVMRYRKSPATSGLTERVEWSTNLVTWSAVGVTYDADQAANGFVQRTARRSVGGDGRGFLRLRVEP